MRRAAAAWKNATWRSCRTGRGRARIERVLGSAGRIENVLEALLVEKGARVEFEQHDQPAPDFADRVDLRDLLTFTVDPDTAKDFDDALSFRREEDGIRAWVHIADVSYFVRAGTPLDRGAARRALSTYVPGAVAPMLPHELADDLCSLRPNEDRLCVTVEIPPNSAPQFYRSVIRSDARLTYGQAQAREAPPAIVAALELNDELARELRARRFARGALQVQTPEVVYRFDGEGGVADAWLEGEPHAHMLVEELMILANEHVAAFLAGRRRESLYRVHERPDPQAVEQLVAKLTDLEVPTPPVPGRLTPEQAAKLAGPSRCASRSTPPAPAAAARHSRRSSSERSSRRATTRGTSAMPASRALRTATSPRRSAGTPIWSCTAPCCASSAWPRTTVPPISRRSPSTPPSASVRRPRSSTSPTRSARPGCSIGVCTTPAGKRCGRGRSSA